jgi:hypothetical protein
VLEQGSRPCGGHTVWCLLPRGLKEASGRRGTHGEQLLTTLLAEMQVTMPLKGFDEGG